MMNEPHTTPDPACSETVDDGTNASQLPQVTLHRIREVRLNRGICFQQVAQLMRRDIESLKIEEKPNADLQLSELNKWALVLDVDVTELLVPEDESSDPAIVMLENERKRKNMMKTAAEIYNRSHGQVRAFAINCMNILLEIDPELLVFVPEEYTKDIKSNTPVMMLPQYRPHKISNGKNAPHRLLAARLQQGTSLRTVGRHVFGRDPHIPLLRAQETGRADIRISQLRAWATALDLPLPELMYESDKGLSNITKMRAQLVRLMKSVESMRAVIEAHSHDGLSEVVQILHDQIIAVMPELKDTYPWNIYTYIRPPNDFGSAATRVAGQY